MILCEPPEPHICRFDRRAKEYRIGTVGECDECGKHWVVKEDPDGWGPSHYWKRIHTKRGLKRLLKKAGCGQETS